MSPRWCYFLPGYLWALPHTLVGLALCIFYGARDFRWSAGCLECEAPRIIGNPAAQTHGWLIVYAPGFRHRSTIRAHERVHVAQGFIGGPLYVLAYGASFLYAFARQGFRDWFTAYMWIPFERHAYRVQSRGGAWGR